MSKIFQTIQEEDKEIPLGWMLHVMPINDIRVHINSLTCPCGPGFDDKGMLRHNTFDGREYYEDGLKRTH